MNVLQLTTELMNLRDETGPVGSVERTHCLPVLIVLHQDHKQNRLWTRTGDDQRRGKIREGCSAVISDLFSQPALQLIEVDDGITGVQQV